MDSNGANEYLIPGSLSTYREAREIQIDQAKALRSAMLIKLDEGIPSNVKFGIYKVLLDVKPPRHAMYLEMNEEQETWGKKYPDLAFNGQRIKIRLERLRFKINEWYRREPDFSQFDEIEGWFRWRGITNSVREASRKV